MVIVTAPVPDDTLTPVPATADVTPELVIVIVPVAATLVVMPVLPLIVNVPPLPIVSSVVLSPARVKDVVIDAVPAAVNLPCASTVNVGMAVELP